MPASFVEDSRRAALEAYEREPIPTWRRSGFWTTSLRKLRLEELQPRHYDAVEAVDELPHVVTEALPEAAGGRSQVAGLIVQRGASTVFALA